MVFQEFMRFAPASPPVAVHVDDDLHHPGAERGLAPVAFPAVQHPAQRLLHDFLGRVGIAGQSLGEAQGRRQVLDDQSIHRVPILWPRHGHLSG